MTEVATRTQRVVPLGSQTWMRWRFGLKVRRLMPVVLLADAAEILGLTARGDVVAERGLLAADFALSSHRSDLLYAVEGRASGPAGAGGWL